MAQKSARKISQIEDRKIKHIQLALKDDSQMSFSPFQGYDLPYLALPETDLDDVDTSTELLGKALSQPLIIASMTGGSVHAHNINKHLAIAAQKCGVAIGVGSQRIMLKDKDALKSFSIVRKHAPDACIFSNIGAVQLNYGVTIEDIKHITDAIQADGLYLHLNPLQEALQPEGDTNFAELLPKIKKLIKELDIPVFVKEVGHGISGEIAEKLLNVGVSGIDVAGTGGTSWAWIESQRGSVRSYDDWFKEIGIPTDQCIAECLEPCQKAEAVLIASGGVRSPIDGLKALLLGADMYSAARPFLDAAMDSDEAVIEIVEEWRKGLQIAMFTSGFSAI